MSNSSAKKLHEEGVALFRKSNPEAALEKLMEALALLSEDDHRPLAEIYNDLGVIQRELGDYAAGHQALDEAMSQFTRLEDKKGQGQTLGNRAALYEAEGEIEEAVETFKKSAKLLEEVGENEMAMYAWQAISRLRTKHGQYIAAIGAYEEGIENMPKTSLKRKILQQIIKTPGRLLGTPNLETKPDDDEKEDD